FIDAKKWEEADAVILLALELDPANRDARQLHGKVQDEIQQQARHKKVDTLVKEAEQMIGRDQIAEGIDLYKSAYRLEPANKGLWSRIEELKAFLDARRRAGRLLAEARAGARLGDLTGAFNNVREALEAIPGNREAESLENEILKQIEDRENERKVRSILDRAQSRRSQGDYEGALALLSADESKSLNSSQIAEF